MTKTYSEWRAEKYSADDMKDLLAKGQAMKNTNGDASYPVADQEDIEKAVKAVGRGGADHDAIRKHIIDGAAKLGLSKLIPDNWNSDGSLADAEAKSRAHVPATREARADESLSFGDIQSRVYNALMATFDKSDEIDKWADMWVLDLGPDWVVYEDYTGDDPGLYQVSYSLDDQGLVSFGGTPVRVDQVTSFVPVQMNAAPPAGEQRADEKVPCKTCDGEGKIRDGNMQCPDCGGSGDQADVKESKSRRRPLQRRRADLPRSKEVRITKTELRAEVNGNDILLTGMPIRYDTGYQVRDWAGSFRETMKPGVADQAIRSTDFNCAFLFNHDGLPLARSTSGTLRIEPTDEGVLSFAELDGRQGAARDLAIAIERRDVYQMSCGFVVDQDEWGWDDDGETRDVVSFSELFDVSAVTYPASPTTSIELAQRALRSLDAAGAGRERIRHLWGLAKDLREGKVLSQQNGQDLMEALEALHSADDVDIPGITKSLETIDQALDLGQAALARISGRANPDGGPEDMNPTLVPAGSAQSDSDARARQRQTLELTRTKLLIAP